MLEEKENQKENTFDEVDDNEKRKEARNFIKRIQTAKREFANKKNEIMMQTHQRLMLWT